MEYQTRKLVASKEFRHMGQDLTPGMPFEATMADARYLTKHGKADYAPEETFQKPVTRLTPTQAAPAANARVTASTQVPGRPILSRPAAKAEDKKEDLVIAPRPVVDTSDAGKDASKSDETALDTISRRT